ncbi:hypothetical protein PTKU15_83770 [Paraburkholderia terrae]|nr:hypothetical protein PTKU15_83770 [Paraburkholderia terrae]
MRSRAGPKLTLGDGSDPHEAVFKRPENVGVASLRVEPKYVSNAFTVITQVTLPFGSTRLNVTPRRFARI